jgi:hypothetical protein
MQLPEPLQASDRLLIMSCVANALPLKFCASFVKARRKPMQRSPFVIAPGQQFEIPAPFSYESFRWHNRNQPKGTQFSQRQPSYAICDLVRAGFAGKRPNDFSAANDVMLRLPLDAVPINQRRANTSIIRGNPRAAGRFTRIHYAATFKIDNRWRESGRTVQFLIAIHREIKSMCFGEKRNGAH